VKFQSVAKHSTVVETVRNMPKSLNPKFSPTFEITRISNPKTITSMEQEWRKLEIDNQITPSVFQSFDWVLNWCNAYADEVAHDELAIMAGRQNGKLVFLFPLRLTKIHGLKALQWLTEPIGQYGDVLCAKEQDAQKWMALAVAKLTEQKKYDLIRLRHVRADSLAAPYVKSAMVDSKYYERAPYLDLTNFANEQEYEARYSSTQRKRRKKIRKNLEAFGEVSFKQLQGTASTEAINQSIVEKNNWLAERGRYNRVMGCRRHVNFLQALSNAKSQDFEMITTELKAGDQPVSWELAFRYRGTHFAYITSHIIKHTDLSPGRLHMDLSQRAALAAGQHRFDLMVPYDLHKESWCSAMVDTNDYFYATSVLGKVYGNIYLRTLRPLIRGIYYKTPAWALRLLQICFFCKKP
jgi:CelD/BcsL family acetyltransferase involved in cellulose biosynthesis